MASTRKNVSKRTVPGDTYRIILFVLVIAFVQLFGMGCQAAAAQAQAEGIAQNSPGQMEPVKIKALLLPKFEIGTMDDDLPGEAQYYYQHYFQENEAYTLQEKLIGNKLYVNKDGLALYVLSMGKLNAALGVANLLQDKRFDFSEAYIISTGCAGSAVGYATMGDVVIGSGTVNYDLGHHIDVRELQDKNTPVAWFKGKTDSILHSLVLNPQLVDKIYALTKDVRLETTPATQRVMARNFNNEDWAVRNPKVLRGTIVTSDNYWKGKYPHNIAAAQCKSYNMPDPYAITEMEDHAVAMACYQYGLLDRYIALRVSVNVDTYINGDTAESLFNEEFKERVKKDDGEAADIFFVAMKNNFAVGRVIIDNILQGKL